VRTILVTLSGTHGSGKSTNAGRVYYLLNKSGKRFSYIRHQDLLDPFGFIVRRMARVLRLDVNYLEGSTPVRLLWSLYFILVYYPLLAGGIGIRRRLGYNVVTDRYLYDLIVGFWGVQKRVPIEHLLVWVLPHPDISFVFDADEKRILSDRPEHSAQFIRNEKRIYNSLAAQFHLTTISTSESKQIVWQRVVTAIEKCMNGVPSNTQKKEQVNN
jgi:thymidylate kinase